MIVMATEMQEQEVSYFTVQAQIFGNIICVNFVAGWLSAILFILAIGCQDPVIRRNMPGKARNKFACI